MPVEETMKLDLPVKEVTTKLSALTDPLLTEARDLLSQPSSWAELALITLAIILAGLIYGLIAKLIKATRTPKEDREKSTAFTATWLADQSIKLLWPVITLAFLFASKPLAASYFDGTTLIAIAEKLTLIWLLIVFIRAFVTNTLVRAVTMLILVPAALLHLFALFDPVVEKLTSYGFKLGEVEITAYTILKAVLVISVILWVGKFISEASSSYIRNRESISRSTQELLIKLFDITLYALLAMTTLNLVGIDLTALAVFSGALGVGLGFGLQKIASNFISGIILLSERAININNFVEMDDGVTGYVRRLGARASVIETLDGKEVMVPNEDFIVSRVANLTHSSTSGRIEIPVGVSYDTDLRLAEKLMLEAASECDEKSANFKGRKPEVYLREYGDNSVNFIVTFWMEDVTTGRWRAQSDVMFAIWDKFKQHEIEIPYPQRDLHIKSGGDLIRPANSQSS